MEHKKSDLRYCVGEIDFLNEVSNVNLGGNLNKCKIEVYGFEGQIPHFHITSQNSDFKTCICLFEPLYFNHGSKQGRLDTKQLKKLDTWLREQNEKSIQFGINETKWQSLCRLWSDLDNPLTNWKNPYKTKQPDYTRVEYMRN